MADSTTTYPNLGFNPVPGVPEHVETMGGKISAAVDSLSEANQLMGRLRNSGDSVWQGDAGNAFREHFNGKLAQNMTDAHTSLDKAVGLLRGWHTDLLSFKDTATKLDHDAAQAKQEHEQAQTELRQAQANPALTLEGKEFPDQEAMQHAQKQIDSAEAGVRVAGAKLAGTEDQLSSIMKQAKELEGQHDAVARKVATELKDATKNLAPEEPGWLSRMFSSFTGALKALGDWVKNHLSQIHTVMSTISAIAGLVAICTPPPVDAIALGVAVVASAGALACDVADPNFRHGVGQLLHGHFDKQSLGTAMTGVTDLTGVIPGVNVAAKALKGGETAAEGASTMSNIYAEAKLAARNPGFIGKQIAKIPGVGTALESGVKAVNALGREGKPALLDGSEHLAGIIWKAKSAASDVYKDIEGHGK